MKKKALIFILAYFPIILVSLQLMTNILALINVQFYYKIGFYLNTFLGTNIMFSFFMLAITFTLKFCEISRAAAIAEVIFGVAYLIIKEDNVYNISIQISVALIAILYTLYKYTKLFPNCKYSTAIILMSLMLKKGNCVKAVQEFENITIKNLDKNAIKNRA